jgi:hypothetical protein
MPSFCAFRFTLVLIVGGQCLDPIANAAVEVPSDRTAGRVWSLEPPKRPSVPDVRRVDRVRTPIDRFVEWRLEANGLQLTREADWLALLRRATIDLTGLPPTPREIDEFLADTSSDAYERLIDRLLDSPQYGERWARHWLDVAGYSDSRGILVGEVPRPTQYLYRDYVIRAFRDDKPYDRFLQEQIAGDELVDFQQVARSVIDLPSEVVDAVIATGFLRNSADASRPDFSSIKHAPMYYFDTLNDAIAIVGSSVMGLTLHCAKCHDHKYDPISQREFYAVQAIFKGGYRPDQWLPEEHRYIEWASDVQKDRAAKHNQEVQGRVDRLRADSEALRKQAADRIFTERLGKLPEQIRADVQAAFNAEEKSRNEVQKYLVAKFQKDLAPPVEELLKVDPDFKAKYTQSQQAIRAEEVKKTNFVKIRALYDMPGEPTTQLLKRGDWRTPGDTVSAGVPAAIATPLPFACAPANAATPGNSTLAPATTDAPVGTGKNPGSNATNSDVNRVAAQSSGRRLAFARWLTQPNHPLTARVMVNRIWLHHFGEGLVTTPDDFGTRGSAPSHPELLDWLATEFVARGWSVKAMHRLIMTSSVYRQSSGQAPAGTLTRRASEGADVAPSVGTPAGTLTRRASEGADTPQSVDAASMAADPANRLLWHFPLRRQDAESIRDSVLAVSGALDRRQFGPAVALVTKPDGEVVTPDGPDGLRRSIYLFVGRKVPVTMLHLFDQPMISVNCTRRSTSTLASQALDLLNSDFMIKQAELFADRLLREGAPTGFGEGSWDPSPTIGLAFKLSLGRLPAPDEAAEAMTFLREQAARYHAAVEAGATEAAEVLRTAQRRALADFGHMLLCSNEFVYVN